VAAGQLTFLDYDERVPRLAAELALVLTPYLSPGTSRDAARALADRVAKIAESRFKYAWEPDEVRCHLCDALTTPRDRVRVAVCSRCSAEPRSPGAAG